MQMTRTSPIPEHASPEAQYSQGFDDGSYHADKGLPVQVTFSVLDQYSVGYHDGYRETMTVSNDEN